MKKIFLLILIVMLLKGSSDAQQNHGIQLVCNKQMNLGMFNMKGTVYAVYYVKFIFTNKSRFSTAINMRMKTWYDNFIASDEFRFEPLVVGSNGYREKLLKPSSYLEIRYIILIPENFIKKGNKKVDFQYVLMLSTDNLLPSTFDKILDDKKRNRKNVISCSMNL